MFDWPRFLDANHIEYITSGANVSGDNIAIHCPWCGHEDPSYHLSVSLSGAGYRCWRKQDHRGRNPVRLVQALLGCSFEVARDITGTNVHLSEDWMARVSTALQGGPAPSSPVVVLPKEFRPFQARNAVTAPYFDYLIKRGFKRPELLSRRYDLRFATQGPWKQRIIFPIYFMGKLVSWTGRTIVRGAEPRYKALTIDEDRARKMGVSRAAGPLTDYLLWYDRLSTIRKGILYICEGPFDALKVQYLGRKHQIYATCLFTSEASSAQVDLLNDLAPNFDEVWALLDQGTLPAAIKLTSKLSGLGIGIKQLPYLLKDPGELTLPQLLRL